MTAYAVQSSIRFGRCAPARRRWVTVAEAPDRATAESIKAQLDSHVRADGSTDPTRIVTIDLLDL